MIRNIVFDIGGVLIEFNAKAPLERLTFESEKAKELTTLIFHNIKWKAYINGEIVLDELIEYFVSNHPKLQDEIRLILSYDNLKNMMPPKKESMVYLKALKKEGYLIYLLSNITPDTLRYVSEYDFIQHIDGGVYSCSEKISKPNPEIYHTLIERYQIKADESIFIDDTKANVEAANELGFRGILFTDVVDLKEKVKSIMKMQN